MQLERSSVKILLGQGVSEGVDDSRALAATVLFRMPPELRDTGCESSWAGCRETTVR